MPPGPCRQVIGPARAPPILRDNWAQPSGARLSGAALLVCAPATGGHCRASRSREAFRTRCSPTS
ncbi:MULTISPECIES: DUF982 domain-containing protein [Bradyrhizobium]|uniref:DUF982 domain-containing protein n=1 Tax=Bradyrhizobium TaxID=374 RepID=UPI003511C708